MILFLLQSYNEKAKRSPDLNSAARALSRINVCNVGLELVS